MERTRAAECHHAGVAIVEAALRRMNAEGACNVLADDVVNAPGRAQGLELQRLADILGNGLLRGRLVELHLAAEEEVRVEIAENEIGVGQRRPRTALAVAGGTRHGAGTARAD